MQIAEKKMSAQISKRVAVIPLVTDQGFRRSGEFRSYGSSVLVVALVVALIIRSMDALRTFELSFNLTDGGPVQSTETLSLCAYKVLFSFVQFNLGAAVTVVQFLVIFALSLVYILSVREKR